MYSTYNSMNLNDNVYSNSFKTPNQNPQIEEGQTTQWQKEKGQTTIYKTLHRKLKIEQIKTHELH